MRSAALSFLILSACGSAPQGVPAPADPRIPAAVRTDGLPSVPDEIFESLRPYQNVRGAVFEDWAPDGKSMLIRTRFGNTSQLHLVREPGGRREQLTFLSEPVENAVSVPDPHRPAVLFVASRGGNENGQIHRLDLETGKIARLTDGTSRNALGPIRRGGGQLLYTSNRRNPRDRDLYLADPRDLSQERLLLRAEDQHWIATGWSPDDTKILVIRFVSATESYPGILDARTGEIVPLPTPRAMPEKAAWEDLEWATDGGVYAVSDWAGEFHRLFHVDLATGKYTALTEDLPWDVEDVEVDPLGTRAVYLTNEDGISRLYLLDPATHERRRLDLPDGVIEGPKFSPDGAALAFTMSVPDRGTDVYAWSFAEDRLVRWTWSELGGLDPSCFVRPRLVHYPGFDGREIPAFVWMPPGSGPHPVVISIHGGPEAQTRPWFLPMVQCWATELGIAVVAPNVRGSTGYGKTYTSLDDGRRREDSVRDIGALLDWIAKQDGLDASRMAVHGGSYGGYMVLASLVHFGDRLRAGVDVVGISDFVTFLERTMPYRQALRRAEYGDERDPEMRKFLESISPSRQAGRIRSALLVAHGKNDPRVPLSEAEQIVAAVRGAGRNVWSVVAVDEGHGFDKKANQEYLHAATVLFWKNHLLPK